MPSLSHKLEPYRVFLGVFILISGLSAQSQLSTADYGESDYDDKDVQFDTTPPNVLILLADPQNGTTVPLANKPNTEVLLDRSFGKVHLFCSAYYPIKWEYHGQGFPFMNVDNTRFTEDFYDPTSYAFSALLELDGLKESQTGNYSCHKWDDHSFQSSFYIYVPGDKVLLPESNLTLTIDSTYTELLIPCAVSDPHANVSLLKYTTKGQGETEWTPMNSSFYSYDPKSGFTFKGAFLESAIGKLLCSVAGDKSEITVISNNTAAGLVERPRSKCCDKKYLRGLGDERTSCRGFISEACQSNEYFETLTSPCTDWKLTQFLKNPVEPCKNEIAPSNSSVGVGYFVSKEDPSSGPPRLFMYCQADPEEYTQGFKMAVEWKNGSMLFVDDERQVVAGLSGFPSGYEVQAEVTDLLNPGAPLEPIVLHCYIPLKYSFKWIKILRQVPSTILQPFAISWYNSPSPPPAIAATSTTTPTRFGSGSAGTATRSEATSLPTTSPQPSDLVITAPPTSTATVSSLISPSLLLITFIHFYYYSSRG